MIKVSRHDWPWWHSYTIDWLDVISVLFAGWLMVKLVEYLWMN